MPIETPRDRLRWVVPERISVLLPIGEWSYLILRLGFANSLVSVPFMISKATVVSTGEDTVIPARKKLNLPKRWTSIEKSAPTVPYMIPFRAMYGHVHPMVSPLHPLVGTFHSYRNEFLHGRLVAAGNGDSFHVGVLGQREF